MKLLTLARDLRRRKARERHGLFVAEGLRAVEELLDSPLLVRGLVAGPSSDSDGRSSSVIARASGRGIPVQRVDDREFASAADTDSPQGLLAIAAVPTHRLELLQTPPGCRLVVLDAVQDPGNVGTIVRTTAALGGAAVVALPGTVDLWNAKVVRSAMGASFRLPTIATTTDELSAFLGQRKIDLWAADARGDPLHPAMWSEVRDGALAIAVGNEGAGLTPALRERSDRLVAIPIAPTVESLNVAVATGILLHSLRA